MSKARLRYVAEGPETQEGIKRLAGDPWNRFEGSDLPQPVSIRLRVMPDGRLVCTGLIIGEVDDKEQELSGRDLRRVSLPDLLKLVDEELAERTREQGWAKYVNRPQAAPLSAGTSYRPGERPAGGWPREHFVQVAQAYRANLTRHSYAPLQALARQLGTTEPTARRWVLRARDMGFLGRPAPGKAGAGDPVDDDELQLEEIWVGTAGPRAASKPRKKRPTKRQAKEKKR